MNNCNNVFDNSQRFSFNLHGMEFFIYEIHKDRKDYLKYCEGNSNDVPEERYQDMQILVLLEQLGYPMNEMGTYLYKNMIVKIINNLKEIQNYQEQSILIEQIKQKYSQFYLDLSRNDLDIGIKTFHKYLELAFEKIDYSKTNLLLQGEIFNRNPKEIEYHEQAYVLAEYIITKNQKQISHPKIKTLEK